MSISSGIMQRSEIPKKYELNYKNIKKIKIVVHLGFTNIIKIV